MEEKMLELTKPIHTMVVPYDDAVIEGRRILSEMTDKWWELGDLADNVEPICGHKTMERFAHDLGINTGTLHRCRSVARAWPQSRRTRPDYGKLSFEVAKDLMTQPDRFELIENKPGMRCADSRALVQLRNAAEKAEERRSEVAQKAEKIDRNLPRKTEAEVELPYQEPCIDCHSKAEQWQWSVSNFLGDVTTMQAYWDHLFGPSWHQYPVTSAMLKLVKDAENKMHEIVNELFNKEHPHEEN